MCTINGMTFRAPPCISDINRSICEGDLGEMILAMWYVRCCTSSEQQSCTQCPMLYIFRTNSPVHTAVTANRLLHTVCICYTMLLHVSAIHLGHLQRSFKLDQRIQLK